MKQFITNQNYIKFYHYITSAGLFASALLSLLTLNLLIPINFKSETAVATGDSTSTTSLTLDVASSTAGVELLVASDSGTFASTASGDEMTFDVTTTNSSGYILSLKSKTGSTDLTNTSVDGAGASVSSAFTSITNTSGISVDTFSNSDNTAYNNHWGIKPSHYESVVNNDGLYYPSPDNDGVILNATDSANVSGSADTYTVAIGARATYTQPAGTYTNTYILSATGNIALTHALSITNGSNISSSTGAGEYSAGEEMELTAMPTSNTTCLTYSTPTWTAKASDGSAATGYFKSTNSTTATGTSVTYVMGGTDDMLTVISTASNVAQEVALAKNNATSIMIGSIDYAGNSATLECGTYNISGSFDNSYKFSSWEVSGDLSLGSSATTASNTITVSGGGTLTLTGEEDCVSTTFSGYMHSITAATIAGACNGDSGTMTDYRDSKTYKVQKINGQLWMAQDLKFTGTSVNPTYTNINTTKTLSYSSLASDASSSSAKCYGSDTKGNGYTNACIEEDATWDVVFYNYAAATAGTITGASNSTNATYDICPKNWHLPTGPNSIIGTDFNRLLGNTDGWQKPSSALVDANFTRYRPGYYKNGIRTNNRYDGIRWSATTGTAYDRYVLHYGDFDYQEINGASTYGRYYGLLIRCVATGV